MRIFKKILLILGIVIVLFMAGIVGIGLYFHHHPSQVKALIEKAVAASAGAPCSIERLSYSLDPLQLRAGGIALKPHGEKPGFHLEIPALQADMTLEGPFGSRTLVLNRLTLERLAIRISKEMDLPEIPSGKGEGSFFGRILKITVALLFFRDIRLEAVELADADVTASLGGAEIRGRRIQANLNAERILEISFSAHAAWPEKDMSLDVPELRLTTTNALSLTAPELAGRLSAPLMAFQIPAGRIDKAAVQGELQYRFSNKTLAFQDLKIDLDGMTVIREPGPIAIPSALEVRTEGRLDLGEKSLDASMLSISLKDILALEAALKAEAGSRKGFDLQIIEGRISPENLLAVMPPGMMKGLPVVRLSGPVACRGEISGRQEAETWNVGGNLTALLKENPFNFQQAPFGFTGIATGTIRADGRFPDLKLSVDMASDQTRLSGVKLTHSPSTIRVSLSGQYPSYTLNQLTLQSPMVGLPVGKKNIEVKDIRLAISNGGWDVEKKSISLKNIRFDSSLLKNLILTFNADPKGMGLTAQGTETGILQTASKMEWIPSGWKMGGKEVVQIALRRQGKNPWSFSSNLGFDHVVFQNPDASVIGEKIGIGLKLKGEFIPDQEDPLVVLDSTLEMVGGEILFDRFYFDLNRNGFFSESRSRYHLSSRMLELPALTVGLKNIVQLTIGGALSHADVDPVARLSLMLPKTDLKPLFSHFVLDPFQTEHPFLKNLKIDGAVSADLNIERSARDWSLAGHFGWRDGQLSVEASDIALSGIDLDLPLWYQPAPGGNSPKPIQGRLSIENMKVPVLKPQALRLSLEALPNRLSVGSPAPLLIPGGHIRVGDIRTADIFGSKRTLETRIGIHITDARPLFSGVLPLEIDGRIQGALDDVRFENNILASSGKVTAKLFGGEMILSELAASGLLTSAPVLRLSASWHDLLLSELTSNTAFGRIEGVLQGRVRDLELAYGQPQRFDLWTETVQKKGVPQRISVEAVDNIAQLGGGQSPFMGLAGGIMGSFFREFAYKKIGIRATLENDVFRVNGTIKEGGKEYIIKRGGFSGVDVVNQNPDNQISFKDMVKRLKRITASKGGPVIK